MLSDDLKQSIQSSYSQFLTSKGHSARYGQKLMIAEIAKALGSIKCDEDGMRTEDALMTVIEAGTGTGKTVAYSLATIPIAKALGKKLVIATGTVALQEQIVFKDLPEIQRHSGLSFTFALAKGRGRYVCLSKLDNLLQQGQSLQDHLDMFGIEVTVDENNIELYESLLDALGRGDWDGDRDNWPKTIEDTTWRTVTTDHSQCTGRRCANVSQCSFIRAREDIHKVDVIVTNHDLVLSDLALGGGAILPPPNETIYIFDEGHHLPAKTLTHFAQFTRLQSTLRWLDQCKKILDAFAVEVALTKSIKRYLAEIPSAIDRVKTHVASAYPMIEGLAQFEIKDEQEFGYDYRPTYRFPLGRVPDELVQLATEINGGFIYLTSLVAQICDELEEAMEDEFSSIDKHDAESWFPPIGAMRTRAEGNCALWSMYVLGDEGSGGDSTAVPDARWISLVDSGAAVDYEICCSPILAAGVLKERLWEKCFAAVITSATMTALGRFDRFTMHAGMPENTLYHIVPSPFDYPNVATLVVPPMNCEPSDPSAHTDAIINCLPQLIDSNAGTLVLFSSRRQMRNVFDGLTDDLREQILLQGDKPKQEMLKEHQRCIDQDKGSILFGLASFAEGIDLPGKYCTHVIIAKIPFAVPDDPVDATLSEWIEANGRNAFMEIAVPEASIKLVQASGRLLRHESDTGRITLLDRRIVTKRYGKMLLDALPPYKRDVSSKVVGKATDKATIDA